MKVSAWIPLLCGGLVAFAYFTGVSVGERRIESQPCESRYEVRDSGIIGLSIRLDKQTGETKMVSALDTNR